MASAYAILRPEARQPMSAFYLFAPMAGAAMYSGHHEEATALVAERLEFETVPDRAKLPYSDYGYIFAAENEALKCNFDEAAGILDSAPTPVDIQGAADGPTIYRDALQLAKADLALRRGRPAQALALLPRNEGEPVVSSSMRQTSRSLVRSAALCQTERASDGLPVMVLARIFHQFGTRRV